MPSCDGLKSRIGIDRAKGTYPGYHYMRLALGEFIKHQYKVKDLAFGQLTEQFIHDYQAFVTEVKGYAIDTVRHYLAYTEEGFAVLLTRTDIPRNVISSISPCPNIGRAHGH